MLCHTLYHMNVYTIAEQYLQKNSRIVQLYHVIRVLLCRINVCIYTSLSAAVGYSGFVTPCITYTCNMFRFCQRAHKYCMM